MSSPAKPALVGVTLLLTLGLTACGSSNSSSSAGGGNAGSSTAGAASAKTYTVKAAAFPAAGTIPLYLGVEKGIFKKYGVTVKFVPPTTVASAGVPQLVTGGSNVALGDLPAVIKAQSKGLGVNAVAAFAADQTKDGFTYLSAMVKKDSPVKAYKDLEGKTVGVPTLDSNFDISLKEAVAKDGGDPNKVKFTLVNFPDLPTALNQGRVDAVVTLPPFNAVMVAAGDRNLGDPLAASFGREDSVPYVAYMANNWLAKNSAAAKAFVEGLTESSKYAVSHPAELRALMSKLAGVPPQAARAFPVPNYTTTLPKQDVQTWINLCKKYGAIDKTVPVNDVVWSGAPTS
jgi:NitT/TauT family transport system substrate-binding protein